MKLPMPAIAREALKRVQERHPYAQSGTIAHSDTSDLLSEALWERLLSAGPQLPRALQALSTRELAFLSYGARARLGDDGVIAVLQSLFDLRSVPRGDWLAFCCLLLTNGAPGFRRQAETFVASLPDSQHWHAVVDSTCPLDSIAANYVASRFPFSKWIEGLSPRIHSVPALCRRIRQHLLCLRWLTETMHREGSTVIDGWLSADLSDTDRVDWYTAYLDATYGSGWSANDAILTSVLQRFDKPRTRRPFWDRVSQPAQKAVERWLLETDLRTLLREGERVNFWRAFLDDIDQIFESTDREAVFISFPSWFAVQYRDAGRATYMYEKSYISWFRTLSLNRLYRAILNKSPYALGHYEHRGYDWQSAARAEVRRVLRLQRTERDLR